MLESGTCKRAQRAEKVADQMVPIPSSRTKLHMVSNATLVRVVYNIRNDLLPLLNGELCPDEEEMPRTLFHLGTVTEPDYGVHTHDQPTFQTDHTMRHVAYSKRLDCILLDTLVGLKRFPWELFGVYTFDSFEGEKVTEIKHIVGQVIAVPKKYTILKSWCFVAN